MRSQVPGGNAFLSGLPAAEFAVVRPHLLRRDLRAGEYLHERGERISTVIFPDTGLVAMTLPLGENTGVGAGIILVGREGVLGGFAAAADAPAHCDAEVHIAGQGSQMSASAFRHILDQNRSIRQHAARFDSMMMAQAEQSALCHAAHSVEARICRWLLEVQDRCGERKVPLTQSTLAQMLGVRRTTVTLVAGRLETAGVVKCGRGYIQIISQEGLERYTCECYGSVKTYVARLFAAHGESSAVPNSAGLAHQYSAS